MSEFMTIHPSQFGCIKSAVLTGLRQMYINSSCPNLGTVINISNASINSAIIDHKKGCCLVECTFLLQHIVPKIWDNLKKKKKIAKESFHVFSFDDT